MPTTFAEPIRFVRGAAHPSTPSPATPAGAPALAGRRGGVPRPVVVGVVALLIGLGGGVAGGWAAAGASASPAGDTLMVAAEHLARPGGGPRVGVVRRTELLVAYHKSPRFSAWLSGLRAERDAAVQRGDTEAAARYEAFGAELQEVGHRQLAQREPLYTILLGAQGELREVMVRHGLVWVREAGGDVGFPEAEVVDITEELCELLVAPEAEEDEGASGS
ncbi:MAG: hypothetical protein H6809_05325 [Phycisphaeraceae bacterium]|nr:hypothetical protein [Phycisphaeraceae bacterium]